MDGLKKIIYHLFVYVLLHCGHCNTAVNGVSKKDMLWEYCQADYFSPQCNTDEVIIMERARYGHIQLGRCIDIDLGHFGCVSNKLSWLDQQCSGLSNCNVLIDKNIESECPSAISRYLEAEYTCQKVFQIDVETCIESIKIPVTSIRQYISSGSSHGTNCGTDKKPWILEAKPGQKVNISIVDFSWQSVDDNQISHPCPVRYGYIIDIDLNEAIELCGGTSRQKHVHLSKGSSLQVIIEEDVLLEHHFIISYQAEGCPTFTNPVGTWTKENDDMITVGCNHNSKTWKMRCIGNNWIGIAASCAKEIEENLSQQEVSNDELLLGLPPVVAFTIIGGIFLVIICVSVTFLIGIFCIKNSKEKRNGYYGNPISFDQHTLQMSNIYPSYRPINSNQLDSNQTMIAVGRNPSIQPNNNIDVNAANGTLSPQYYILDRDDKQAEAIYDVVYQNT